MENKKEKILITGGGGMVGGSFDSIIHEYPEYDFVFSKKEITDFTNYEETHDLFEKVKPNYVIHLAAKVGGVKANSDYLADFYTENIKINTNVLQMSKFFNVKKVVSVLSTCIYPDKVKYPLTEEQIHNGEPHKSNYAYAYAKRMLDIQSQAFRDQYNCNFVTAVSNNIFGENDNFHLNDSHVIPALIRKVYESKKKGEKIILWGSGSPMREFTYSKDVARSLMFILKNYDDRYPINIGNTEEISIKEVAYKICDFFEYGKENIIWDTTKPEGQMKKPSSNKKFISLGWKKKWYSNFEFSLNEVCEWFVENYPNIRGIIK